MILVYWAPVYRHIWHGLLHVHVCRLIHSTTLQGEIKACGHFKSISCVKLHFCIFHLVSLTADGFVNPLVPGMRNIEIRKFIIDCLLTACNVKRPVCLEAHYSERQGLMGITWAKNEWVIFRVR